MSQPKGAAFLVEDSNPADLGPFPEAVSDEIKSLHDSAKTFVEMKVCPNRQALENHDNALLTGIVRECGEGGYLGVGVPEKFGGFGLDFTAEVMVSRGMARGGNASFAVTHSAHTGISTWPILYFGTDAQREKWLPKLASGEAIGAYALTEAGSGSDALAAKTTARLSDDGQEWILNGSKIFITNAAVADLFTVFAKVDPSSSATGAGGKPACFLVERGAPGLSVGKEEHKLGIRGSSTCPLSFDDCRIPVGNLLGTVGRGHEIVMNTLNLGRFKLGAAALGGISRAIDLAVRYCAERHQFGRSLLDFDATKAKIAEMAIDEWVGEAMVYRLAGDLTRVLHDLAPGASAAKAIKAFEIECALVKVALSEMNWRVVDHCLQLHGGYGYSEEFEPAGMLRDVRINRIFEGTNEINRLHAVSSVLKRAMKGEIGLNLFGPTESVPTPRYTVEDTRGTLREATTMALRSFFQNCGKEYAALGDPGKIMSAIAVERQQPMLAIADMMLAVYALDCATARDKGQPAITEALETQIKLDMLGGDRRPNSTLSTRLFDLKRAIADGVVKRVLG